MANFVNLCVAVMVSASLLTACAQKPQYYQAAYAKETNPKKNTEQGRKNTTQSLITNEPQEGNSKQKGVQPTPGFDRDAALMTLALPFIIIIGGIIYEINKDD